MIKNTQSYKNEHLEGYLNYQEIMQIRKQGFLISASLTMGRWQSIFILQYL